MVTVTVQFPDLSAAEYLGVRERLAAAAPGRVIVPHHAHRWYTAASDPEAVTATISALRAVLAGTKLSFDDADVLDDLIEEYADWLDESELIDDAETATVMSFSVHLPALSVAELADLLSELREQHPRRIVLGEQRGHSHHEVDTRSQIVARMPALRAAAQGHPINEVDRFPLEQLLNDLASWLDSINS